jgi:hypothetical protein
MKEKLATIEELSRSVSEEYSEETLLKIFTYTVEGILERRETLLKEAHQNGADRFDESVVRALWALGEKALRLLPPDIRSQVEQITDRRAQYLVQEMPGATAEQIEQYQAEFFLNISQAPGYSLSEKVARHMRTEEFQKKMVATFNTGKVAAIYCSQFGIVGELIQQNLQLFLIQQNEEIQRLRSDRKNLEEAQKNDRATELEHQWEKIRLAKLTALERAIAFSQWWRLLAAAMAGAIVAGPIFLNWPVKIMCEKGDWVCLIMRVKSGKYIAK